MFIQQSPNSWSCLPTAVAIAFDIDVDALIEELGHDGSKITHAGLPEPMNRQGFHPQELIEWCLQQNYGVTKIDMIPCAFPDPSEPVKIFNVMGEKGEDRFMRHMHDSWGWIDTRTNSGLGHAVAYRGYFDRVDIYDSNGQTYSISTSTKGLKNRGLNAVSLFRIDYLS